jgi:hypothetical protein
MASMFLGSAAVYLSYVRSALVLLVICLTAMLVLLVMRGEIRRVLAFTSVAAGVAVVGFMGAVLMGGDGVKKRLGTLVEDNPTEVYNRNRGLFLWHTFDTVLPEYPLGAGLARWGMVSVYFGDRQMTLNTDDEVWVEIQWTGWALDGGVPLVLAYALGVLLTLWTAFRIAMGRLGSQHKGLWPYATIVFAYSVGGLALTFSFPFFVSQAGLEFWVLNALLYAAAVRPAAKPSPRPAPKPVGGRPAVRGLPA